MTIPGPIQGFSMEGVRMIGILDGVCFWKRVQMQIGSTFIMHDGPFTQLITERCSMQWPKFIRMNGGDG